MGGVGGGTHMIKIYYMEKLFEMKKIKIHPKKFYVRDLTPVL